MNINTKHVAALLAASAMAFGITAANAQPGPGCDFMGGPGMSGKPMRGEPGARAEQHLARFKSELKITPQQEPLWQAFADQVKTNAGQGMPAMREAMQQQTAPERMDHMVAMMKTRATAMESVSESFKRLYAALTPEQKAVADKFHPFAGHMRGGRMGGPGGRPGQGPGPGPGPATPSR